MPYQYSSFETFYGQIQNLAKIVTTLDVYLSQNRKLFMVGKLKDIYTHLHNNIKTMKKLLDEILQWLYHNFPEDFAEIYPHKATYYQKLIDRKNKSE